MKEIKESFVKIYREERGLLVLMILNFLFSAVLFIYAIFNLGPLLSSSVVKVGYGDIAGYRDGTWVSMLVFPLVALVFGVLHSLLATKIFSKRGVGLAKVFVITTICMVAGAMLVLARLLGEV